MKGGFPVTNGFYWKRKTEEREFYPGIPDWAKWTGYPEHENYAHIKPGEPEHYSSGGYWRLSQALTAVWGKDLKQVFDERVMSKIAIPAQRWQ